MTVAGVAALVLAGCGKAGPAKSGTSTPPAKPKYQQSANVVLNSMDRLASDLARIKTIEAAAAAVPRLERQADELKYAINRLKELPPLAPEDFARERAHWAARAEATSAAFQRQTRRIRGHSQLRKPLSDLQTRMSRISFSLHRTILDPPREPPGNDAPPLVWMGPPPGMTPPEFAPPEFAPPEFAPPGFSELPLEATANPPGFPPAGPAFGGAAGMFAADRPDVFTIEVSGVPPGMFPRLVDAARELNDYQSHSAQGSSGKATIRLDRMKDFETLPDRITFGKVLGTNAATRTISVELNPQKLP